MVANSPVTPSALFIIFSLLTAVCIGQSPQNGLKKEQISELYVRLRNGDLAAVEAVLAQGNEGDVFNFFWGARGGQYADSINQIAKSRFRDAVIASPDIAFRIGRKVERGTETPGNAHSRESYLLCLADLGTDECVAVLGSFLQDERDPDKPYRWIDGVEIPGVYSTWNAEAAAAGLARMRAVLPGAPDGDPYVSDGMPLIRSWRKWWASDDAAKYREVLAKHQGGDAAKATPPPEPTKLAPQPPPLPSTAKVVVPPPPASRTDDVWLWLILALGLLMALLIPFIVRRRSRR